MHDEPCNEPRRLGYYADAAPPLLPVVRSVAWLCIIYGLLRLAFVAVDAVNLRKQWVSAPQSEFFRANWIATAIVPFVLSPILVLGGSGCLRLRPFGRRLVLVWAWLSLAWIAYGAAVNTGYSVTRPLAGTYWLETTLRVAVQLEQWLPTLVLPLAILMLMTRPPIAAVFEPHRRFDGPSAGNSLR